jgi:hypothetical protein
MVLISRVQTQAISPIKKLKKKKTFSKKLEKVMYSPKKKTNSNKKPRHQIKHQEPHEFESFQKQIRSKFGYNVRKKIERDNHF